MKKRNLLSVLLVILIIVTLALIWGNSLQSIPESKAKSGRVLEIIAPFLEFFVGKGNVTDHLVRKLAHFTEYFVLGIELSLLMVVRSRVSFQGVCNCLFVGLAAAVTDESIQIISNRGPLVSDVLLDFCGVSAAVFVVLLIFALIKPKKRYRS